MLMWITAQIKYYFSASSMTCTVMPYYILKKEKKAILLGNSSTWGSKSQIENPIFVTTHNPELHVLVKRERVRPKVWRQWCPKMRSGSEEWNWGCSGSSTGLMVYSLSQLKWVIEFVRLNQCFGGLVEIYWKLDFAIVVVWQLKFVGGDWFSSDSKNGIISRL